MIIEDERKKAFGTIPPLRENTLSMLRELLIPGNKVRIFYYKGNPNNCLLHIRAIVDNNWIVYKVWSKQKKYWVYLVNHISWFQLRYDNLLSVK